MIKLYSCHIMIKKSQQKAKFHGRLGEETAKNYLINHGYLVLHTNFHSKFGEIDIIAEKIQTLIFTEVKTRTDHFKFGLPEEAMNRVKLLKMKRTIYEFFIKFPHFKYKKWRIDLVTVVLNSFEETSKIVHYKNVEIN